VDLLIDQHTYVTVWIGWGGWLFLGDYDLLCWDILDDYCIFYYHHKLWIMGIRRIICDDLYKLQEFLLMILIDYRNIVIDDQLAFIGRWIDNQ